MKRADGQLSTADVAAHHRRGGNRMAAPQPMSELMADEFDPAQMSAGYKRGMVLLVYKSKIKELLNVDQLKRCLADLENATLSDRNDRDYERPILYLHFKSGSLWRTEMGWHTHTLRIMINDRLKCNFLRK